MKSLKKTLLHGAETWAQWCSNVTYLFSITSAELYLRINQQNANFSINSLAGMGSLQLNTIPVLSATFLILWVWFSCLGS